MNLKDKIRVIEDFPKEGLSFKDITTLIGDESAILNRFSQRYGIWL